MTEPVVPGMWIAWDAGLRIIHFIDFRVLFDENDQPAIANFAGHEISGQKMRVFNNVVGAIGAGSWPEWIGSKALDFRVEINPGFKKGEYLVAGLVHHASGNRRRRADVDAEIDRRIQRARQAALDPRNMPPVDIRDVVGGPDRPLHLDDHGLTVPRHG